MPDERDLPVKVTASPHRLPQLEEPGQDEVPGEVTQAVVGGLGFLHDGLDGGGDEKQGIRADAIVS